MWGRRQTQTSSVCGTGWAIPSCASWRKSTQTAQFMHSVWLGSSPPPFSPTSGRMPFSSELAHQRSSKSSRALPSVTCSEHSHASKKATRAQGWQMSPSRVSLLGTTKSPRLSSARCVKASFTAAAGAPCTAVLPCTSAGAACCAASTVAPLAPVGSSLRSGASPSVCAAARGEELGSGVGALAAGPSPAGTSKSPPRTHRP
mmetsp:Transcript_3137/g.9605  ORF Transcript_3137/g.9605 Transcript_3137/m.9605 type:complete len:202 (+) Transcript_3137:2445-3050(+)